VLWFLVGSVLLIFLVFCVVVFGWFRVAHLFSFLTFVNKYNSISSTKMKILIKTVLVEKLQVNEITEQFNFHLRHDEIILVLEHDTP
jgi:hypothetical protein